MQTYTREEQCRLWLQSAPSLSWRTREALLTYFGCAESIFEQMGPTVQMMAGDKAYAELQQMKTAGLDALIDRLHRCGAEIIFCGRTGYPALLGEINDPPHALFIRGTPAEDRFSVAIVGSRRDTRYGRSQAFSIARDLAAAGVTVVSGLARGIDTAAHEGALAGGGRTVAVLGNGIDRVYPEENTRLAQTIVEHGGAIISEFALGAEPLAHHFPIRNRIISGVSAALLLIEGNARYHDYRWLRCRAGARGVRAAGHGGCAGQHRAAEVIARRSQPLHLRAGYPGGYALDADGCSCQERACSRFRAGQSDRAAKTHLCLA